MTSRILLRRGTAAQWASANPILGSGELGVETDTLKFKIGNGTSTWTQLTSYANITPSDLTSAINGLINAAPSALDTLNELAAAINNDSSFSTTVNNLLSGKVSKSGGDIITAATASTTPLAIKAAASQTADLLVWQNNSGTTFGRISSNGVLINQFNYFQNVQSLGGGSGLYLDGSSTIAFNTAPSQVVFKVAGYASQTADLQQWQNSAGTVLAKVDANGQGTFNALTLTSGNGTFTSPGWSGFGTFGPSGGTSGVTLGISPYIGTNTALVVRGYTSQSANLQEWQNSSGTALSRIKSNGNLIINADGFSAVENTTPAVKINSNTAQNANEEVLLRFHRSGVGSTTYGGGVDFKVSQWQSTGAGTGYVPYTQLTIALKSGATDNESANINVLTLRDNSTIGINNTTPSAQLDINIGLSSRKGLIVKADASQTANLQEWQNSAGTVLAKVSSAGRLVVADDGEISSSIILTSIAAPSITTTSTANNYGLTISGSNATTGSNVGISFAAWGSLGFNGVAVPGAAVWFTRTGSFSQGYLSFLTRTGNVTASPLAERMRVGETGTITIAGFTDSSVGLIVKGAASQTANLQEWQNSAGSVTAKVSSSGAISSSAGGFFGSTDAAASGVNYLAVRGWAADHVPFAVKGFTAQTGDLTRWINDAGTVLTSISSTGKLTSAVDASINGMTIGLGGGNGPTNIALGNSALLSNTTGFGNSAIGLSALQSNTTGWGNVGIGTRALQNFSGNVNTAIGYESLRNATAEGLVAIGYGSLASNTSGGSNTAVGYAALNANITGGANTAFGSQSSRISTGHRNTSVGFYSAYNLTTGTDNTFLGSQAGQSFTTGSSNIAIGSYNSWYDTSTGSGNTFVGVDGGGQPVTGSNNTTLGYQTTISSSSVSNEITLGNSSVTRFRIPGIGLNITSNSTINTASAAAVGIIIKGAASQTANLQEWQNSSGTVLASITSNGTLNTTYAASINNSQSGAVPLTVTTQYAATSSVIVAKGAASQTGDLQQWQNSAGTVLAKVDNAGAITVGSGRVQLNGNNTASYFADGISSDGNYTGGGIVRGTTGGIFGGTTQLSSAGLTVYATAAGNPGAIIRGASSQTANLQEWQNSSGTAIASVDVNGRGSFTNLRSSTATSILTVTSAASVVLTVKGAASQTANLQEWQDSTGAVLNRINSAGHLVASSRSIFGGQTSIVSGMIIAAVSQETAAVPILAKGSASQTADLQQWQNSSGTVLAKVDASGNFILNGITMSQSASSVTATNLGTTNNRVYLKEENSGGQVRITKSTAAAANNRATDLAQLYLRDGTTPGTLKLVIIAGTAGAETTILDNIPQS